MQILNRGMLSRYDIPENIPAGISAVQFGMEARLLALVDRLIDDANIGMGIACVQTDNSGFAEKLAAQDCMFTAFVRGYLNDQDVHREQVVQSILKAVDPEKDFESLNTLAEDAGIALAILDMESETASVALGLAAKFLVTRKKAGLNAPDFICFGDDPDCAARARTGIAAIAASWGENIGEWMGEGFYPAMADGLVYRSSADEAAKLCAAMNYADSMIHIAEPYADMVIQAPESFREKFPLNRAAGVSFADDLAPELEKKHRIFDAGLFLMAGPGYLAGCDTLYQCMKKEDLREFVGRAFFDEIIPNAPFAREEITPYVVSAFERFENPFNENGLLEAAHHLFRRFMVGALPVVKAWADENFEAPPLLGHALAAAIMLYAGARPNAAGVYEVARGQQVHPIHDEPEILQACAFLAHDMPAEALAYAALADRNLWAGQDLRDIDGLESRVTFSISAIQQGRPLV